MTPKPLNDSDGSVADLIVVSGASGGIGRPLSAAVSRLGRHTVLIGRDQSALDETAEGCQGAVRTLQADVSVPESIEAIGAILDNTHHQRIVVVAGAGVVGPISPPGLEDPVLWEASINTNLLGVFRLVHPFLDRMRRVGWGRVVAVSSAQTLHGPDPVMTSYATAKLAVNAYIACLAAHFAGTGVSACAIHPGDVLTRMGLEIERKADEAGEAAVHLRQWAHGLAQNGGDDPRRAGELVAEVITRPAVWSNGRFLLVKQAIERHPMSHWSMDVGPLSDSA